MPDAKSHPAAAATPHPECAAAARDALRRGGNAVDAACAAMLAACVVLPGSTGLGGYGGSMVAYLPGRGGGGGAESVVAIDFDSRAPLAYRDDLFVGNPRAAKLGYLAVSTPAVAAGLDTALRQFGTHTFAQAAAHALRLAEGGFPMDPPLAKMLDNWKAEADPVSINAFFPGGTIPAAGEMWAQHDLARLIRRLCDEGPGALYRGEVARQIVRQVHGHGGILSEADLAAYEPAMVRPHTARYRGYDFFTPPPPSGGLTSLQILKALEHFDVDGMGAWSGRYFHTLAEVTKACWRDRDRYLGDPDVVKVPADDLLSDARAREIAAGVGSRAAKPALPPGSRPGGDHTVNIVTADAQGNVCSLTATQGDLFGSGVVIDGLGLVLGHGMSRFEFGGGHPNAAAPGKRMHHNMSPMVVLQGGKPRFVIGMPGGPKIVNVTAQIAVNLIDFRRTPAESVKSPRLHTEGGEPLNVNGAVSAAALDELEAAGHSVKRIAGMGGPANALSIDPASGHVAAASEAGVDSAVTL